MYIVQSLLMSCTVIQNTSHSHVNVAPRRQKQSHYMSQPQPKSDMYFFFNTSPLNTDCQHDQSLTKVFILKGDFPPCRVAAY